MSSSVPVGQDESGLSLKRTAGVDNDDTVMNDEDSPLSDPPDSDTNGSNKPDSEMNEGPEPPLARTASSHDPEAPLQTNQGAIDVDPGIGIQSQEDELAMEVDDSTEKVHATRRTSLRKATPQLGDADDELMGDDEPMLKKTKIILKKLPNVRKGHSKWDNVDTILTDWNSPLGKTKKLRDLLLSPQAWDVLEREDKQKILKLLPDPSAIVNPGTELARPDVKKLLNNDNFSHDVAHYQRDLREGRHDPEWIRQAQAAHGLRAAGHYDEYLAAKFEEDWEMKMPGHDEDDQKMTEEQPAEALAEVNGPGSLA